MCWANDISITAAGWPSPAAYLAQNYKTLDKKVYSVPDEIDQEVASLKLAAMHIGIDTLTPEQVKYMSSWSEGT